MMVVRIDVWWTVTWWTVTWWTDVWLDATLARLMGVVVWMAVVNVCIWLAEMTVYTIPHVVVWNGVAW